MSITLVIGCYSIIAHLSNVNNQVFQSRNSLSTSQSGQQWVLIGTDTTDSSGRLVFQVRFSFTINLWCLTFFNLDTEIFTF